MELLDFDLRLNGRPGFKDLYFLGDIHLGSANCDEEKFEEDVDEIAKNKDAVWIGMGDYCEFITPSDVRFEGKSVADWIKVKDMDDLPIRQAREFIKRTKLIHSKALGLLAGNHENTIRKRYHQDIHNFICVMMNTKNMGYVSFCRLKLFCPKELTARKIITLFAEHGAGGGRLLGGKVTNLDRKRQDIRANIYVRGHVHEKMDFDRVSVSLPSHGEIRLIEEPQLLIISGSYLRTLSRPGASSYTECASFPLVPLGCKAVRIKLGKQSENGKRNEKMEIWRLK